MIAKWVCVPAYPQSGYISRGVGPPTDVDDMVRRLNDAEIKLNWAKKAVRYSPSIKAIVTVYVVLFGAAIAGAMWSSSRR